MHPSTCVPRLRAPAAERSGRCIGCGASKTAATPATQRQAASELPQWLKANGARYIERLQPASFQGLRGLRAATQIKEGDLIALIPRRLSIWTSTASPCPFPDWIDKETFRNAPLQLRLALCLLHERALGPASKFQLYLDSLPDVVDLPYFWRPGEVAQLHSPHLQARIALQQQEWADWWDRVQASSGSHNITRPEFDWALACVSSRGFKGPYIASTGKGRRNLLLVVSGATALTLTFGLAPDTQVINAAVASLAFNVLYDFVMAQGHRQYALCPYLDLANSSPRSNTEVQYNYFDDGFVALLEEETLTNEQVMISYGPQTSDSLVQYYGFLAADNANDIYTFRDFRGALLATGLADEGRMVEIEREKDPKISGSLESLPLTAKAQVTEDVKAVLRYVMGACSSVAQGRGEVSNTADAVVWQAVGAVVEAEAEWLEGQSDLGADRLEARAAARAGDERRALIARYRVAKQEFLKARGRQIAERVRRMSGGDAVEE